MASKTNLVGPAKKGRIAQHSTSHHITSLLRPEALIMNIGITHINLHSHTMQMNACVSRRPACIFTPTSPNPPAGWLACFCMKPSKDFGSAFQGYHESVSAYSPYYYYWENNNRVFLLRP